MSKESKNNQALAAAQRMQAEADAAAQKTVEAPPAVADAASPGTVTAVVPKAFKLRLNTQQVIDVQAGTQSMPRALAEHWYSVANGVTIFK